MHRLVPLALAALLATGCSKSTAEGGSKTPGAASSRDGRVVATTISGRIVGHDGQAPRLAHVRVLPTADAPMIEAKVDRDGRFRLQAERAGLVRIEITAVDHAAEQLVALLDGTPVAMTIRLGTYPRPGGLEDFEMAVWKADPSSSPPSAVPLSPQADGTLVAEIATEGERLWYQLGGTAEPGRIVNGPVADAFEYDGGGDYRSVIAVSGGKVRIVIDPRALPPPGLASSIAFDDSGSPSAVLRALGEAVDVHRKAADAAIEAAAPGSPQEAQAIAAEFDWAPARRDVLAAVAPQRHAALRHAMLATYFECGPFDPAAATAEQRALAAELLGDMPADDPGWTHFPTGMSVAVEVSGDPRHVERLDRLIDDELPAMVAAELLLVDLMEASMTGDAEASRAALQRLQRPRLAETPYAMFAKQFDPDRAVRAGQDMPAFDVAALDAGQGARVTNEDLGGKVWLVDLWATWCKPCVAEMENLHAVHDKYMAGNGAAAGQRPFGILSISLDGSTDDVAAFRKNKWPMPWRHGHMTFSDAEQLFGVSGIPYAVLIDEHGKILATSPQVSGASLDGLLSKLLAEPPAK